MSQRNSEYSRIDGDTYVTPRWVFERLVSTGQVSNFKWVDPAPVNRHGYDFLKDNSFLDEVVSNPPFSISDQFVTHALAVTASIGKVAMLLPHTWDTAQSRIPFFTRAPFKCKFVLTKRIRWDNLEQKKNGPSTNHAWYLWDWKYDGPPTIEWIR